MVDRHLFFPKSVYVYYKWFCYFSVHGNSNKSKTNLLIITDKFFTSNPEESSERQLEFYRRQI
jgi:hypothetical protein